MARFADGEKRSGIPCLGIGPERNRISSGNGPICIRTGHRKVPSTPTGQNAETLFSAGSMRQRRNSPGKARFDGKNSGRDRVGINFGHCRFIIGADGIVLDEKFGNFHGSPVTNWISGNFRTIWFCPFDSPRRHRLEKETDAPVNAERFYENGKGERDHASLGGRITGRHHYTLALEQKGVKAK